MANRLTMATIHAIESLYASGHSGRRIAELLNVDRGTVAKYLAQLQNPPNAPTGSRPENSTENPLKPRAKPGKVVNNPARHPRTDLPFTCWF